MGREVIELQRKDLWVSAYHAAIEEVRRTPFSWSSHDCVVGLAARVVLAITGIDLAAQWRGQYDDAISAYRVLQELGCSTVADLAANFLPEYEHQAQAHLGDIAAIPTDTLFGHVLGVFNGENVAVLTEQGLGWYPRRAVTRAFRVGRLNETAL